jgi:hypothetical protein
LGLAAAIRVGVNRKRKKPREKHQQRSQGGICHTGAELLAWASRGICIPSSCQQSREAHVRRGDISAFTSTFIFTVIFTFIFTFILTFTFHPHIHIHILQLLDFMVLVCIDCNYFYEHYPAPMDAHPSREKHKEKQPAMPQP